MNTIMFLSGEGVGALLATSIMLAIMFRAVGRDNNSNREQMQKQHDELIALRKHELDATYGIGKSLAAIAHQGALNRIESGK